MGMWDVYDYISLTAGLIFLLAVKLMSVILKLKEVGYSEGELVLIVFVMWILFNQQMNRFKLTNDLNEIKRGLRNNGK